MVERIERTEAEVEAALLDIQPQIRAVTFRRLGRTQPWLLEDAQQEANIAAWTRLVEGFPVEIAIFNAAQRVVDIGRGKRPTGSTEGGSGKRDTFRTASHLARKSTLGEEYEIEPAQTEPGYDEVEVEEILSVLEEPHRTLVREAVLEGYSKVEIAERHDLSKSTIHRRLREAYDALRPALAS